MLRGKTKVIATLGPSCREEEVLAGMIEAGLDLVRINASHAEVEVIREQVSAARRAASRAGRELGVILDLMGPKIRVGEIEKGGVFLSEGKKILLTPEDVVGTAERIRVNMQNLPSVLIPGDEVLLDDGSLALRVEEVREKEVLCRVERGGILRSRKGVNLPGKRLRSLPLTDKDRNDLRVAVEEGVDWVALSFVLSREQVAEVKEFLRDEGSDIPVIAKIEKREAVEELEGVVEEADGVMVARGDLGVEMPLEEVPLLQKRIIETAARKGKPVITATQMLQSMVENPAPTRAEVADVANAVLDGTDAVMLSGETAVGKYPVEAVCTMQRIIDRTEVALPYERWLTERGRWSGSGMVEAVCFAACELALRVNAAAIVTPTESGFTARQMSRFRPVQPIIAPTPELKVARRLTLHWGVYPRVLTARGGAREIFAVARKVAREEGLLPKGGTVVVTAGLKERGERGMPTTNTIHCIREF